MRARSTSRIVVVLTALVMGAGMLSVARADAAALPTLPTAGANNWSCKPTRTHPSPVVIVHGTFGDSKSLLDRLSWTMHRSGYCVFSLNYGNRATGPIAASAQQLKTFVNRVLATTKASKVSLVGHSQGGMMPRYYIKFLGGAGKVDDLVGLSPSNHGTSNPLLLTPGLNRLCPACLQQKTGSVFLRRLNAGDETPGTVSYTNIVTRRDEVVLPYTSGFLKGPRTTNITLQAKCPHDLSGHLLIPMDGPAIRLVLNALARKGPARAAYQPSCLP
jgi:triacylglycerol lipase